MSDVESTKMLTFAAQATAQPPMDNVNSQDLDGDVRQAIEWIGSRTESQIREEREIVVAKIEALAAEYWSQGQAGEWLSRAPEELRVVIKDVCGPLAEFLVAATNFEDPGCVESLRTGAPLIGELPAAAGSVPHQYEQEVPVQKLREAAKANNLALIASLKSDKHEEFLMQQTLDDHALGRMTKPIPVAELDLSSVLMGRRFSREQGTKDDGTVKLRAVDDKSADGTNASARATGKPRTDGIDRLVQATLLMRIKCGCNVAFWKADVDAAYRRVPVRPEEYWVAWVAFMYKGVPMAARHMALMFGSLGSVHGWDRIGSLIRHLARVLLHMPVMRYVDDFFSVEKLGTEDHAMQCFARVVRALMGGSALNKKKLAAGEQLVVLGLNIGYDEEGVWVRVNEEKATQWTDQLDRALKSKTLSAGEAGRVAGRLSFAAQHTFKRAGRAALRPIFRQQYDPLSGSRIGSELAMALEWWKYALGAMKAQCIPWEQQTSKATLLTDARGTPPRVAAVLIMDDKIWYTDWEPDEEIVAIFEQRKDAQIMGLELLAIAVGLCTFADALRGRSVGLFCDNVGGEHALAAGAARAPDHNRLIHSMWMLAMKLGLGLMVQRVPTKDNIADLPSRESYDLLEKIGAIWVKPVLHHVFYTPKQAFKELAGHRLS
jgi:hypothetical protein